MAASRNLGTWVEDCACLFPKYYQTVPFPLFASSLVADWLQRWVCNAGDTG